MEMSCPKFLCLIFRNLPKSPVVDIVVVVAAVLDLIIVIVVVLVLVVPVLNILWL